MYKNFFLIAYRNIIKNKYISLLNIIGLSTGILCFVFIFNYFISEKSYDRFHAHGENIYRVTRELFKDNALLINGARTPVNMGQALKDEFPEVIASTKLCTGSDVLISYNNVNYLINSLSYADSSFFKVFTFLMKRGDPKTALNNPNSVVLTKSLAIKIFGSIDLAMGKTFEITHNGMDSYPILVKGVMEDFPSNSHLKTDMLVSFSNVGKAWGDWILNWPIHSAYTYIQTKPGTDYKKLESKLPVIVDKYLSDMVKGTGNKYVYHLQPLFDIHLYSNLVNDTNNGNAKNTSLLLIAGIFILLISWVNNINLSTAKAMERAKEIAVRKVIGSNKLQIIKQIVIETIFFNLLPVAMAIIVYFSVKSYIEVIFGVAFINDYALFRWGIIFVVLTGGAVLCAIFPAIVLSRYRPDVVLKGKYSHSKKGIILRKGFTALQFVAASLLLLLIIFIQQQIKFMQSNNIGIDIKNTVIVKFPIVKKGLDTQNMRDVFIQNLESHPNFLTESCSSSIPGKELTKFYYRLESQKENETGSYLRGQVDYNYFNVYKPKFLAGRNFYNGENSDKNSVIITRSSLKMLGIDSPDKAIGKIILSDGKKEIIGVIEDYHHLSLKENIQPIIFHNDFNNPSFYTIKLNNNDFHNNISILHNVWKKIYPYSPFEYFILEDFYNNQYLAEINFNNIFKVFTILSIIIACLGLFALSYYDISLRTKEICIRKILGSSILGLFSLLSKSTIKICVCSLIIAWAIGYYFVNTWLQNFAFHINISILVFVFSGMIILIINILTISYNVLRIANINPARIIKDE